MRTKVISVSVSLLFAVMLSQAASAAMWYVDVSVAGSGDGTTWETAFQKIEEGIDAASDGDTVVVAEGTYTENMEFNGKNIVLRSTDPTNSSVVENTIIDGGMAGTAVTFAGTESAGCVLAGFTITNGAGDHGGGICGGTPDHRTRATIEGNVIAANSAEHGGGLAYCEGTIQGNIITGNSAAKESGRGGGLFACDGTVIGNIVSENSGDWGGGLAWCDGTIGNNSITGNSAGAGGGLCECNGSVQNNVISENSATNWGGGLARCNGLILSNLISDNLGGMWGGGMMLCSGSVENNTIVRNSASSMGGGVKTCDATVRNCIVWGNTAGMGPEVFETPSVSYSCIQGWAAGGEGNSGDNPSFVDYAGGDYRLSDSSPCIDCAENRDWMWQAVDADGNPRILRGKSSVRADMGAYEYNAPPTGTVMTWYVDGSMSASGNGTSWGTAKQSIQEAMDVASDGDVVLVAQGDYSENIAFKGKNILLQSSDGHGAKALSNTFIDGNQSGPVVTFSGNEDETCILSGFTIRNGSASSGGGILGGTVKNPTHARIQNNLIIDNSADKGGGLAYCDGPILNNTIRGNSATSEGSGLYSCRGAIRNCIIWGNVGGNPIDNQSTIPTYSCIEGWFRGGDGNSALCPYFMDAVGGDYRLQQGSPCIDKGDPVSSFSEEPSPNGGRINMGAFGSTTEAASRSADSDRDGLPDDWEMDLFGHHVWGGADDPDWDLKSNRQEYCEGTDPTAGPPRIPAQWYVDSTVLASGDGRSWETAFFTIQEGVDAASNGDTVTVSEGIYTENLRFKGKNITVRSINPSSSDVVRDTIIDGGQLASVASFAGMEDHTCVLTGFTIRNGKSEYGGGLCGGTPGGDHTQATVRANVITGNSAHRGGGLAYCDGIIEGNIIAENSAARGGGLAFCNGLVHKNVITDNTVTGEAGGGGALESCCGIISNNMIATNSVTGLAAGGGGLSGCHAVAIRSNMIRQNSVPGQRTFGGGVSLSHTVIENNTVVGNSVGYGGGGLAWCGGTIRNCIVWGNSAASVDAQLHESPIPDHSCIQNWSGGGERNLSADPQFADSAGNNYRLSESSPCIDKGLNEEWMWDAVDLDSNPRIWPGATSKPSLTADMGAYEYGSFPFKVVGLVGDSGQAELTWNSRSGHSYTVLSCSDLMAGTWIQEATVPSGGDSTSWTDPDTASARKFYRIELK